MDAVRIRWRDAYDLARSSGWLDAVEEPVECIIDSLGFVLYENEHFVVICHSLSADGMSQGAFGVPKSCIIERTQW